MTFSQFKIQQNNALDKMEKKSDSWWNRGPRYALQLYDRYNNYNGKIYITSIEHKGELPETVNYKNKTYKIDLEYISQPNIFTYPMFFIPYIYIRDNT